jgi:hypothetical protein
MAVKDLILEEALMPEFFQGISGVGNQFPNKDIPLRVERMDNYIE